MFSSLTSNPLTDIKTHPYEIVPVDDYYLRPIGFVKKFIRKIRAVRICADWGRFLFFFFLLNRKNYRRFVRFEFIAAANRQG